MKIVIDWYRHGLSCANVFHQRSLQGALAKILPFLYTLHDPDLTRLGWQQAVQTGVCLGAKRDDYDLVGSSVMSRAIETALGIWSGSSIKTIHVLPHVGERRHVTGMDVQNTPQESKDKLEAHMEAWKKVHKVHNLTLDYSFLNATALTKKPSADSFYSQTLPHIIRSLSKGTTPKKTIRIAIVSHGGFMRENLRLRTVLALETGLNTRGVCGHTKTKKTKPSTCCSSYKDPAWEDAESYSVPNTAAWREELNMSEKEKRIDRLEVRPWYTPNPQAFRIYRTGKKDPLFRSDLEGCDQKVIKAVIK